MSTETLAQLAFTSNPTISRIELGQSSVEDARTRRTILGIARALKSDFREPWIRKALANNGGRSPQRATGKPVKASGLDFRAVPIVGRVAAGKPIDEISEGESVAVDPELIKLNGDVCALSVRGDSMVEHHILDKDVLICRKTAEPRNRSIVVVNFQEPIGAAVKFWHRRGNVIQLSSDPDGKQGEKFEFSAAKLEMVYEIVGLIRKMK